MKIVTYNGGILSIKGVLDEFDKNFPPIAFEPDDLLTIRDARELLEKINMGAEYALRDINACDILKLEMDVNYILTTRSNLCGYYLTVFNNFYQLIANIRHIKECGEFGRIVADSAVFYACSDTDTTKVCLNSYYGIRSGVNKNKPRVSYSDIYSSRNKEEKKMIKPVKVIYNDMSATVFFNDGTKTTVTCTGNDKYDENTAIAIAYTKRMLGSDANGQWQKNMQVVRQAPKFENRLLKYHMEFIKLITDIEWLGYELGMWSEAHCIKELSVLVYNVCHNDTVEFQESDYRKLEDLIDMIKDKYEGPVKFDSLYSKLSNQVKAAHDAQVKSNIKEVE